MHPCLLSCLDYIKFVHVQNADLHPTCDWKHNTYKCLLN